MSPQKAPYLKNIFKSSLAVVKEWKLFDGAQECTLLDTQGLGLCMDKAPPPLVTESAKTESGPKPAPASTPSTATTTAEKTAPKKEEPPVLIAAWKQIQGWVSQKNEDRTPKVESFDLYDLPIGMHAEGFPVSEAFAKRWFNGRAYSAYVKDPQTGKMVEGRYDKDMIDTDTVKLAWLMGFPGVKAKYEDLLARLANPAALNAASKKLVAFFHANPLYRGDLDTLKYVQGDLQHLHDRFQFQVSPVNIWDDRLDLTASNLIRYLNDGGMSDVAASLGNFSFYATIARANIKQQVYNKYNTPTGTQHCVRSQVEVTHVYVYARDSYSFNDAGNDSQYLGHWNKTGVVMNPSAAMAALSRSRYELGNETVPPFPIDIVGKLLGRDIYYPIRNRDFVNWRARKGRGGDFLVYSDLKLVKLETPMAFDLGEMCQ